MTTVQTDSGATAPALVAAADLRAAADWLEAHLDVPTPYSIFRYDESGAEISFRTTDPAERSALVAKTGDGYRWISEYDDHDWLLSVTTTEVWPRLKVAVVLVRPEATC